MLRAFEEMEGISTAYIEDASDMIHQFDAVAFFLKARYLLNGPPLPWKDYSGLKVILDHDALQDYCSGFGTRHLGLWTANIPRLGFDLAVVSGNATASHLSDNGIDAVTLHKGFAQERFRPLGRTRAGICSFGTPYRARSAMFRTVTNAGIPLVDSSAPYSDLNESLNQYQATLVCNMGAEVRWGKLGRAIERYRPGTLLKLIAAPEPMIKNFEAAASGCAVFMDDVEDLDELGFIDGHTAIIYRDFSELIDKLDYWLSRPSQLERIGLAAAELCAERHTWRYRAQQFVHLIESRM